MSASLVGSEMCIRDRSRGVSPRAVSMARRCGGSIDPAFSTSNWTLTSGRRCCITMAAAGTAQKSLDWPPQTPTAPLVAPA
eukprot:12327312-Alexandrium_andersonii.AAC.1